jgi:hypothetical protein
MSRSLSYLRRGLLGIAVVGSLGFGATQAWGSPSVFSNDGTCPYDSMGPYKYRPCNEYCGGSAYCDGVSSCVCVTFPGFPDSGE